MGIPWTPVWQGGGITGVELARGDWDLFAVGQQFRSCCPAGGSGRCRADPGPAGAPDPLVEFRQDLRVAGEGGIFVEWDLELRVGQFLQHAEHIKLGFVHGVFDLLDQNAPELLAPVIEALLRGIPPGHAGVPAATNIPGTIAQGRFRDQSPVGQFVEFGKLKAAGGHLVVAPSVSGWNLFIGWDGQCGRVAAKPHRRRSANEAVMSKRKVEHELWGPHNLQRRGHLLRRGVPAARPLVPRFRSNEVRLWLSLIAYNLGNLWRRLVLPKKIENWSLTSMQQRLVKTGGRLVKHARYYWLM